MPFIKVEKVGDTGLNTDQSVFNLPPTVWTDCQNVAFLKNSVYRTQGFQSSVVIGTPSVTPYFIFKGKDGVQENEYTIYAGLTKVFAFVGQSNLHNNITRQTAGLDVDYTASVNNAWQAGILNGILVLNNGSDIPQKWTQALGTQDLTALDGFTSVVGILRATVVRPFKNYLIALNITKGGIRFPQMVKWSTSASAGNIPLSWDETNATNDAGEFELAETPDYCVDMLPLRDVNIIYKENSVWGMRFIGFPFIFQFYRIFTEFGAISKNCVVEFKDRHVVLTQDDVIIHDGQSFESIVNDRIREGIFSSINAPAKANCFVYYNSGKAEVYIGIPTNFSYPDVLWVWNSRYNTWSKRDIPNVNAISVDYGVVGATVWDSETTIWDNQVGVWNAGSVASDQLIMVSSDNNKLYHMNSGTTADGIAYSSFVVKEGFAWSDQEFAQNNAELKFFSSLRPEISASAAIVINISLGIQMKSTDVINYSVAVPFTPGVNEIVYFNRVGRYFSLRFETLSGTLWELKSYLIDVRPVGLFA